MIQEIVSALNSAKYDDSRLVLFSGLGNIFCSGTDLHFLVSGERAVAARQMAEKIRSVLIVVWQPFFFKVKMDRRNNDNNFKN